MATQVSLNDGAVASAGALAIQTNGTTQAVSISTGQVATVAQNPILTSGTANGVAYLNGSKAVTSGSALVFDGTNFSTTGTIKGSTTIGVGNATPSTSGAGITFPATQSASTNANTLDDYEEGTFTPTCTLATPGTSSSGSAVGVYTKVGNLVTATGRITFTKGTGTGDVVLGGLPFTSTNTTTYQNSGAISTDSVGVAGKTFAILLANNSTAPTLIAITQVGGAGAVAAAGDLGTSAGIRYTFSYQID